MPPALAQKSEQLAKRRKVPPEAGALDRWGPPEPRFRPSTRFKRQGRHKADDSGPRFGSSAAASGLVLKKARRRRDERHVRSERNFLPLPSPMGLGARQGKPSSPPPLDRAIIQLKRLTNNQEAEDEDFVKAARATREAMKAALHSDPPMADVCLVISDALTFSVPEKLTPRALGTLASVLPTLIASRADDADPRRVFSSLLQAGWQMTPEFGDEEFVAWAEEISG